MSWLKTFTSNLIMRIIPDITNTSSSDFLWLDNIFHANLLPLFYCSYSSRVPLILNNLARLFVAPIWMVLVFYFFFLLQRLALRESNISRYNAEFVEISTIGSGQFGSVHKCVNRLGKCFLVWCILSRVMVQFLS